MTDHTYSGLFISEGTSDLPLADLVEALFIDRGVSLFLSRPDFTLRKRVSKDVRSRIEAGLLLTGGPVDVVVVHRDADNGLGQMQVDGTRVTTARRHQVRPVIFS